MPSSETPGNPPSYPQGASFGQLLSWHLDHGTRPGGSPGARGRRWGNKEFAAAVGRNERSVRNWRGGRELPLDPITIERELFGAAVAYDVWCHDLRDAYGRYGEAAPSAADVPFPPGDFLGRDMDVEAVRRALLCDAPDPAVLVQGSPGIGKTALTKAVAHDPGVVEHFGERPRWFVRLETATTVALLQDAVTRAVGADPQAGFRAALTLLQKRPGLLVLDNLETPWEPPAERRLTEEVLAALARVPGLAVLASFRGRERVGGPAWTLVHPVERLAPPFDAELFARIAGRSFADDPYFERLLASLDGVPLAIELVAHHAYGSASLAPLWSEWERIGAELARHPDYAPGKDTSLPHSIELSVRSGRMTEASHRLFRLLGELPAGIAAADRDHLLGAEGFAADEVLRRIGLAVARGERLDLLSPIREHARRLHRPETPDEVAWSAHYLDLARHLGERIGTKDGAGATARLVPEFANISAAIKAVLPHRLNEAMAALKGFGRLASMAAIPAPVLDNLADACKDAGDVRGEAICLSRAGDAALSRSDHDGARRAYREALIRHGMAGDVQSVADCIFSLGSIALTRSEHDDARQNYEQALILFRQLGDVQGEANCIASIAGIALRRSDHDSARRGYEQALPLFRQAGNLQGEANCLLNFGHIALAYSDHDGAREAYEQALPLYRQTGSTLGEANCIKGFGNIALARSDQDSARQAFEMALSFYRRIGNLQGEANCMKSLGNMALRRFDDDGARRTFDAALPLYRKIGDVQGEARCIASLGQIALRRSDHDRARRACEEALPLFRKVGDVLGEANCILDLGEVEVSQSNYDGARQDFEKAQSLYRRIGNLQGEANCLLNFGHIAMLCSNHEGASRDYRSALILYRQAGSLMGEANCTKALGEVAIRHSDHDGARRFYHEALTLHRKIGDVQGEADCARALADLG